MLPGAFINCTLLLMNHCINSGFLKTPTRNTADIKTVEHTTTLEHKYSLSNLFVAHYCVLYIVLRRLWEWEVLHCCPLGPTKTSGQVWRREDNCFFPKQWAQHSLPQWRVGWAVGKRGSKQGADWEACERRRRLVCDRVAGLMPNLDGICLVQEAAESWTRTWGMDLPFQDPVVKKKVVYQHF